MIDDNNNKVGVTQGVKQDLKWWAHAIRNGNKALVIAFIIFLSSLFILGGSFFIYLSSPSTPTGLCDYESPRKILTSVKNVEGPAAEERGQVVERATRCVQGDKDILSVLAYRTFRNIDTNVAVQDLVGEPQNRSKGKTVTDTPIQLPEKVTPGKWKLEGLDVVPDTGELRTWFSEPFIVVAK